MGDKSDASPLIPPSTITEPSEIDLEAGPGEQIQCRICLETDGNCSEITQFCKTFLIVVDICSVLALFMFLLRISE